MNLKNQYCKEFQIKKKKERKKIRKRKKKFILPFFGIKTKNLFAFQKQPKLKRIPTQNVPRQSPTLVLFLPEDA